MQNFDKTLAENHLKSLLKNYKIKVHAWSATPCGWAKINSKSIKIPHPTNVERFCVGMHEIAHIINGKSGKLYEREYACEMFAIKQAELLSFDVSQYRERARRYVIMCIAKGYCRKLKLSSISKEIKNFCKIDFSAWGNKKVFVQNCGDTKKPLLIKIY